MRQESRALLPEALNHQILMCEAHRNQWKSHPQENLGTHGVVFKCFIADIKSCGLQLAVALVHAVGTDIVLPVHRHVGLQDDGKKSNHYGEEGIHGDADV